MPQRAYNLLRRHFKRIGPRLMTLYLLLLLIPIVGITVYGHVYVQRMLTQAALTRKLDEVAVRASAIDALLGHLHGDILYLEQRFRPTSATGNLPADASAEVNGLAASHPMYESITLLAANGDILAGYDTNFSGTAFDQLRELPANSIRFYPMVEQDQIALIAGAHLDAGVLAIEINTAHLLRVVSSDAEDANWALFMPPDIVVANNNGAVPPTSDIARMTSNSGYVTLDEHVSLYHTAGPGRGWLLIHSAPNSVFNPDLSEYYTTLFLIIVGGFVAVFGLALWAIAYIIGPVYQLEQMVDQLRQGIARPALPRVVPDDELGKLITAFDHMAAELEEKRQTERALIEQLIRAQEEERKLLAYDLHDGLIQELVGARLYLGQVRNSCTEEQIGEKVQSVLHSYNLLTHAIAEGRRIIQGLHPTVLEDLGLEAALDELGRSIAVTASWKIHMEIDTLAVQPDRATSVIVYRITQEALNNAFKHAQASEVWLRLTAQDDALDLSIRDNGQGFAAYKVEAGNGWGIKTMQERAVMLRGTCSIESRPDHGTTVQLRIPYRPNTENESGG